MTPAKSAIERDERGVGRLREGGQVLAFPEEMARVVGERCQPILEPLQPGLAILIASQPVTWTRTVP